MDDTALQRYFAQSTQLYQRQHEALRAVVYEGKSQKDAARTFGFHYDSFRQLLHQFRGRFVAEQIFTYACRWLQLGSTSEKTTGILSLGPFERLPSFKTSWRRSGGMTNEIVVSGELPLTSGSDYLPNAR